MKSEDDGTIYTIEDVKNFIWDARVSLSQTPPDVESAQDSLDEATEMIEKVSVTYQLGRRA